jgi:hypothetical protein
VEFSCYGPTFGISLGICARVRRQEEWQLPGQRGAFLNTDNAGVRIEGRRATTGICQVLYLPLTDLSLTDQGLMRHPESPASVELRDSFRAKTERGPVGEDPIGRSD